MDHETTPGDPLDFDALYATYASAIHLFFIQHVGNAQDAEDLTASTFSRALASRYRYREQGRLAAWIFSIARHTLQDERRRWVARMDRGLIEHALMDSDRLPESQVLQSEQACQLHDLLRQLPADQRQALVLRFFGDLPIGEIAECMSRSTGSIKMLIHRALARLRERYRQAEQAISQFVVGCAAPARLQYALRRLEHR